MTRCHFCDHDNPRGATRCSSCGAELPDAPESTNSAPPPAAHLSDIADLMRAGQKIEAIKRYRQMTGLGLAEAKDAVEAIERGEQIHVPTKPATPPSAGEQDVIDQLEAGNLINAIKVYRAQTGLGLKESKAAVERLARERGISISKAGCAGVLLLATASLASMCTAIAVTWRMIV